MKSIRYILFALSLPLAVSVSAQQVAGSQVQIENKAVTLGEDTQLLVGMDITLPADMKLTTNSMLTLTPILMEKDAEGANKALPSIHVYGRTRQLVAERTGKIPVEAYQVIRRDNGDAQTIQYTARVPYEKWMNGSDLKLMATVNGCANCLKEEDMAHVYPVLLKRYVPQPVLSFVKPEAEIKIRTEKGKAYLDFPVNQTKIYKDYRRNPYELEEIKRTINVVKDNPDTKITGIILHGYTSPEGSYANNERLAKGRSEALKKYIMDEYGLSADMLRIVYPRRLGRSPHMGSQERFGQEGTGARNHRQRPRRQGLPPQDTRCSVVQHPLARLLSGTPPHRLRNRLLRPFV